MQKALIFGMLILFLFTSCGRKSKKGLIPEDKLVPMLVDLHLTVAIQYSGEHLKIHSSVDSVDYYSYIFEKYGYTRADFDSTLAWYTRRPGDFVEIYDEVIMQLTRINDSLKSLNPNPL